MNEFPQEQAGSMPVQQETDPYASLVDPNSDRSHLTIEGAAVREPHADPSVSAEGQVVAPAAQEPLTDQDIAQLTRSRGEAPTEDEIKHMNSARASGKHMSIV